MNKKYYEYIVKELQLQPLDEKLPSNKRQKVKCLLCNNVFEAIPKGKVANYRQHGLKGCKNCTDFKRYENSRIKNINFVRQKFVFMDEKVDLFSLRNDSKVKVRNKNCNHIFSAQWSNLKNDLTNCPICNKEEKIKRCKHYNNERHKISLTKKDGYDQYKSHVYKLTRENYKKYRKIINPDNLKRTLSGGEGYHLDHIISVKNCFEWNVPAEICADHRNLRMIEWKKNNQKRAIADQSIPEIFCPYIKTTSKDFVDEITLMIKNNNLNIESFKDFNGRYGLSLYVENLKIGFYYADFQRCSQQALGTYLYFAKMKEFFDSKNIRLLIIFEDEWLYKNNLVKNKIFHVLNISDKSLVHARKCIIKPVKSKIKNKFMNENHIQGTCSSNINLGAYMNDELVAVMTFTKPRIQMGKNKKQLSYELSRFVVKQEYKIPGVASKILKYFRTNYEYSEIFSFADLRWSDGNLYEQMGFELNKKVKPDYYYIIDGKRKHRWNYRKDSIKEKFPNIYDSTKTEYQMMLEAGYDRIWNCGYYKYNLI